MTGPVAPVSVAPAVRPRIPVSRFGVRLARVGALVGRGEVHGEIEEAPAGECERGPVIDERRAKAVRGHTRGAPHGHRELLHA